jgi:hypothetical protein
MGMFNNPSFDLRIHELSEDEFQALALDGYSCIGHEDIAQATGFAYNKEPVSARVGDVLLLVQKYYKGKLGFHCIQVVESETPLIRETEALGEI